MPHTKLGTKFSKLLVRESRTSNVANLSCILVPDLSGTCSIASKFLVRGSGTSNLGGELLVYHRPYLLAQHVFESLKLMGQMPETSWKFDLDHSHSLQVQSNKKGLHGCVHMYKLLMI